MSDHRRKIKPSSIPFRGESEIGDAATARPHRKNLTHFIVGQIEIENLEIFGKTLDL
jgi:hypothetical protein